MTALLCISASVIISLEPPPRPDTCSAGHRRHDTGCHPSGSLPDRLASWLACGTTAPPSAVLLARAPRAAPQRLVHTHTQPLDAVDYRSTPSTRHNNVWQPYCQVKQSCEAARAVWQPVWRSWENRSRAGLPASSLRRNRPQRCPQQKLRRRRSARRTTPCARRRRRLQGARRNSKKGSPRRRRRI